MPPGLYLTKRSQPVSALICAALFARHIRCGPARDTDLRSRSSLRKCGTAYSFRICPRRLPFVSKRVSSLRAWLPLRNLTLAGWNACLRVSRVTLISRVSGGPLAYITLLSRNATETLQSHETVELGAKGQRSIINAICCGPQRGDEASCAHPRMRSPCLFVCPHPQFFCERWQQHLA